jgi:hypothetical protein
MSGLRRAREVGDVVVGSVAVAVVDHVPRRNRTAALFPDCSRVLGSTPSIAGTEFLADLGTCHGGLGDFTVFSAHSRIFKVTTQSGADLGLGLGGVMTALGHFVCLRRVTSTVRSMMKLGFGVFRTRTFLTTACGRSTSSARARLRWRRF